MSKPDKPTFFWIVPVLALASVVVLASQAWQWNTVPNEDDTREAVAFVDSAIGKRDGFWVVPTFDSRPRVGLQKHAFQPSANPVLTDFTPFKRIFVLVEDGHEEHVNDHVPPRWTIHALEDFGRWSVWRLDAPETGVWTAIDDLANAKVSRHRANKKAEVCNRQTKGQWPRWDCRTKDRFLYVGESMQLVTNDPHRCIWAMPIDRSGTLKVSYDNVHLGGKLEGNFGQTLDAVRSTRGAPVSFRVFVDDKEAFSDELGIHTEGYRPFSLSTPQQADVRFEIHASSQLDRFFCFTAWGNAPLDASKGIPKSSPAVK